MTGANISTAINRGTNSASMRTILLLFILFLAAAINAQSPRGAQNAALRVYLDCPTCDQDFVRTSLSFVDFVRDPTMADLHILITNITTGSGGKERGIRFIGKGNFEGMDDTLRITTLSFDTDDSVRRVMTQRLKLGLMRYVARTAQAGAFSVSYDAPARANAAPEDPWDSWMFSTDANAYFSGQKLTSSSNLDGRLTADRVTPEWKFRLSAYLNYSEGRYQINDTERVLSISRGSGFDAAAVKSISDHWSAGFSGSIFSSTYYNARRFISFAPAIEYDVYPYADASSRQIRFQYKIGVQALWYNQLTIYDKMDEVRPLQTVSISAEARQTWGTISCSVTGYHYFPDFEYSNLQIYADLSLRVAEGFSLRIGGNGSLVHDQFALPKAGASEEEVLLQRARLATSYSYSTWLGLSYRFGSIYNSVVNPRFN
jgi:hypothetical protein